MTILTKPISEKKPKQVTVSVPLVLDDETTGKSPSAPPLDAENGEERIYVMVRPKRFNLFPTACLCLTALLVLSIGVVGGLYLYQRFPRTRMQTFRGWCNIPFDGVSSRAMSEAHTYDDLKDARDDILTEFFKEQFELDLESNSYAKIDVPDFSGSRHGRFVHDFALNKTAIIDLDGKRCFVMALNRSKVLPPRNIYEIIERIPSGYYEIDTNVVRQTMRVVTPPVTDYSQVGIHIKTECSQFNTYLLEELDNKVYKRSISTNTVNFSEFAGEKILQFNILLDNVTN